MFIVPMTREVRSPVQFARLLDDTVERFLAPTTANDEANVRNPALDVTESERAYTVKLEMPGVTKEDVKVAIEGRQVSVTAQNTRSDEATDGARVVYRERSVTSYARRFKLASEIDQGEANAKLEHGVLTLVLPKRDVRTAAQLTVN